MKTLKEFLPESFLTELTDANIDSISPINGGDDDNKPDPLETKNGKRELNIGDPVIVNTDALRGKKGVVDNVDGDEITVSIEKMGNEILNVRDVEYDHYHDPENDKESYEHALNNLKQLAGY
jgi:transcription antitermination factor NusG